MCLLKDPESESSPSGVSQTLEGRLEGFEKEPVVHSKDHPHPICRQSTYWLLFDLVAEPGF